MSQWNDLIRFMPPLFADCLFVCETKSGVQYVDVGFATPDGAVITRGGIMDPNYEIGQITHWMPIPPIPKKEEK